MLTNAYKELLEKEGFLPLQESDKWKKIQIDHTVESAPDKNDFAVNKYIKDNVKFNSGVYIYTTSDGKVLYIGHSRTLVNRLKNHYEKSYGICQGSYQNYYDFFGRYREVLNVYICDLDDLFDRLAIESMLIRVLEPAFLKG